MPRLKETQTSLLELLPAEHSITAYQMSDLIATHKSKPLEKCSNHTECCLSFQESPDCAVEQLPLPDLNSSSESLSLLSTTSIGKESLPGTIPISPVTQTLELSSASQEILRSSVAVPHARGIVEPTPPVQDLTMSAPAFGGKCSDLSTSADRNLLSGKTLSALVEPATPRQESGSHLSEEFFGVLPPAGTMQSGKVSAQPPLERPTFANGSLLLPTPMAHSRGKDKYRPPGGDKLERTLKLLPTPRARGATKSKVEKGNLEAALNPLIPKGHVSHPAVREYMMGFPDGWTDITGPAGGHIMNLPPQSTSPNVVSQTDVSALPPSEIPVHHSKLQSYGEGSDISLDFFKPQTLVWSCSAVDGKGIARLSSAAIVNTVRSHKTNSLSKNPSIDTLPRGVTMFLDITGQPFTTQFLAGTPQVLKEGWKVLSGVSLGVRWDGNNFNYLIPPNQLQLLEEPLTMIALAPNQTFDESVTLSSQTNIPSEKKAEVLTERESQSVQALPEAQTQPEPEPESVPVEALKELVSPTESNTTENQETLSHLEEEGEQSNDGTQSGDERDRTEADQKTDEPEASTSITLAQDAARPPVRLEQELSLDELASAINHEHQLCQGAYKSSLLHARKVGEFLLKAKAMVKESSSGRWLTWLSTNCPDITKRTAQAYMQVAAQWEQLEKSAASALFGFKDALKLLGGKSKQQELTHLPPKPERADIETTAREVEVSAWNPLERDCENVDEIGTGSNSSDRPVAAMTELTSVCGELKEKPEQLGLQLGGTQVLPSAQRNHFNPADVDDHLFTCSQSISASTDEICFSFIGSIEYLNHEHIVATVSELAQRTNPQKLEMMGNEELKLLVQKLNLLAQKVKALLLRRTPGG